MSLPPEDVDSCPTPASEPLAGAVETLPSGSQLADAVYLRPQMALSSGSVYPDTETDTYSPVLLNEKLDVLQATVSHIVATGYKSRIETIQVPWYVLV